MPPAPKGETLRLNFKKVPFTHCPSDPRIDLWSMVYGQIRLRTPPTPKGEELGFKFK
jgi:hypothetical protein